MKTSFLEWCQLLETVNVKIPTVNYTMRDLNDLSHALYQKALNPILEKLPEDQMKAMKDRFKAFVMEMITPDGGEGWGTSGVMNFYVGMLPDDVRQKAEQAVDYFVKDMGVDVKDKKKDTSRLFGIDTIRYSLEMHLQSPDNPRPINISNDNAVLIFRDVLGYSEFNYNNPTLNVSPQELVMKISQVSSDKLPIHAKDQYTSQIKGRALVIHGEYTAETIQAKLNMILNMAKWAIANGHDKIVVS